MRKFSNLKSGAIYTFIFRIYNLPLILNIVKKWHFIELVNVVINSIAPTKKAPKRKPLKNVKLPYEKYSMCHGVTI